MFTDRMAQITSEFAAQVLEALREASREELSTRRAKQPRTPTPREAAPKPVVAQSKPARHAKPAKTAKPSAPGTPDATLTAAAAAFFAERGRKGATADQLSAHFTELGIAESGDAVLLQLARDGAVHDAGFRRSTGTGHKTTPVYVASR